MIIRKTQNNKKKFSKSWVSRSKESHIETYIVTTWWFLFIPIIRTFKIQKSNL